MTEKPVHIVSDIHLGAVPKETEHSFVRWLENAGQNASRLIINGDLFDFWFEYRSAIPRGHTRVLGALTSLVDAGLPITMMGGNHDWWGGSYLTDEVGLTFLQDPVVLNLAGHRTFLAHGDGLGRGDLGYRMLRGVVRGRFTRWCFAWLHPDMGAALAKRISRTEHHQNKTSNEEHARSKALRAWSRVKLPDESELDLVVLGHTQVPVIEEIEPHRFYVNSGDWVYHRSYLVLQDGEPPTLTEWHG